jgi:hypothetical protein
MVNLSWQASDGYKQAVMRLTSSPVFPAPDNAFFGRFMFFLDSAPTGERRMILRGHEMYIKRGNDRLCWAQHRDPG